MTLNLIDAVGSFDKPIVQLLFLLFVMGMAAIGEGECLARADARARRVRRASPDLRG